MESYFPARAQIAKFRPLVAVLENVNGILLRRGGCRTFSSKNNPPAQDDDTSCIDFFLSDEQHGLSSLPGYSVAWVPIDGLTLPTTRPRIYFIVVAEELGPASDVASRVIALRDALKTRLVHTLESLFPAHRDWTSGPWLFFC